MSREKGTAGHRRPQRDDRSRSFLTAGRAGELAVLVGIADAFDRFADALLQCVSVNCSNPGAALELRSIERPFPLPDGSDQGLMDVVAVWLQLPPSIRSAILTLARSQR